MPQHALPERTTERMTEPVPWLRLAARVALDGAAGPFELDVDLGIARGQLVAIVGPSGAGKTTLLRVLAGLSRPDAARIEVGGATWCDTRAGTWLPTHRRSIGFVFQDYALFPNMSVRRNVEYALGASPLHGEAARLLALAGLEALADAKPARLSGGQKQRLALIRALARRPALLMLDEPLSALDPDTRRQLQHQLQRLHREFGTTTLLVSHDTAEILRLADRVLRLERGRVSYDGPAAGAFGAAVPGLVAQHLSGPDASGMMEVCIDGRVLRARCRDTSMRPEPGDEVLLSLDGVEVQRLR